MVGRELPLLTVPGDWSLWALGGQLYWPQMAVIIGLRGGFYHY